MSTTEYVALMLDRAQRQLAAAAVNLTRARTALRIARAGRKTGGSGYTPRAELLDAAQAVNQAMDKIEDAQRGLAGEASATSPVALVGAK